MAARFWIGGGTNTNWNASPTTNWCATSGGTIRVAAPTVADDVTFDGAGGGNSASNMSTAQSCLSLTLTSGYTNTLTMGGILTIAGNFTDNTAHTWAGASGITISAASTITSGGKTFPNAIIFSGAATYTLAADWSITGSFSNSAAAVINGAFNLNLGAGFTIGAAVSGTATIVMNGSGTLSGSGGLTNNFTVNTAGTFTFSGLVNYGTGTFTYTAGTVVTTGSTLGLNKATVTLNTAGIIWNNISTTLAGTITLNSLLTSTGTLNLFAVATVTFAGSFGFTVATLTNTTTSNVTLTLVNGVTYTVTTALTIKDARVSNPQLIKSASAGNQAILILNYGATCNCNANFTDITAVGGRTIFTFNGVLSNTANINTFTDANFPIGRITNIQSSGSY